MDVKEITQKIIDTYKVAQPLYENHAPLHGSDVELGMRTKSWTIIMR
jgi:hypothetical protein